jgi:hypothetical protein
MLPALIVGALTAWYLGLKLGLIAAGIAFGVIVIAGIVPGLTIAVYAILIGWCALLYLFGTKLRTTQPPTMAGTIAGGAVGTVGRWVGKARKMFSGDGN